MSLGVPQSPVDMAVPYTVGVFVQKSEWLTGYVLWQHLNSNTSQTAVTNTHQQIIYRYNKANVSPYMTITY
jgi:ectoine hydroxylase-related dioxygenase (phytanoyl-CoA dioxygenase family)